METPMINKIADSVAQALSGIQDGSTVLIGGFGTSGIPGELIDGLIEQGARELTVAMKTFYDVRNLPGLKKKPSTSELVDWLKLLVAEDIPLEALQSFLKPPAWVAVRSIFTTWLT